jgi:hypothetical protein
MGERRADVNRLTLSGSDAGKQQINRANEFGMSIGDTRDDRAKPVARQGRHLLHDDTMRLALKPNRRIEAGDDLARVLAHDRRDDNGPQIGEEIGLQNDEVRDA